MTDILEKAAVLLRKAYTAGPVPPLREFLAVDDAVSAYQIQALNTRHWEMEGRRVVGQKIGLTAKAVQTQLGVDQPDYGILFNDMAIADGGTLRPDRLLQPKAEAEVAFVLANDVEDEDISPQQILRSIDHVLPAIEIVDSRIAEWKISFADTVADNGSSACFALGTEPRLLAGLDLKTCGMALEINGEVMSLGAGVACLGHPLNALTWLARTAVRSGRPLRAGDIVLSGALGPMVPIQPGQSVRATIGGLGTCGFYYETL